MSCYLWKYKCSQHMSDDFNKYFNNILMQVCQTPEAPDFLSILLDLINEQEIVQVIFRLKSWNSTWVEEILHERKKLFT